MKIYVETIWEGVYFSSSSSGFESAVIFMNTQYTFELRIQVLRVVTPKNSYRRFERLIEREESLLGVLGPDD